MASMTDELAQVRERALAEVERARTRAELEAVRIRHLGRKGIVTELVRRMREVPPERRREIGAAINALKAEISRRIEVALDELHREERRRRAAEERIDVTVPGRRPELGRVHPLRQVIDEIVDVFRSIGFEVAEGPDVEDDYHNFQALNFPPDHPARDMQDTLFVEGGLLLRTHTSPVQIRVMERRRPPLRVVVPGAVYRHDSDVTHSPMFHQIEGFMVDRDISFAHLKGVLTLALQRIFGDDVPVRLRPSFFPFTEPSAEVDVGCFRCSGSNPQCRVCKGSGWLEMLGAGLIHPNVFRAVGYDPEQFGGFAFGMGIERIAMCKYNVDDIRLFFSGDVRFLRQF